MSNLQSTRHNFIGGYWFVLAAAVLWGTTGTAQSFAPTGFDPKAIGALRLLVGGVALTCLTIKRKEFGTFKDWQFVPVFLAGLFTASYQVCFFSAVAKTGVAVGTVVAIGSAPIAGGLLGLIFRGERLGRHWVIATILAIIGCSLLNFSGGDVSIDLMGTLLALAAGVSYAAYTLTIKGLLIHHNPNALMAAVVCVGALILSPVLLNIDTHWLLQSRSIAVVLHLGLASMALSYWLFARGLKLVQVSTAVTLTLVEPLTAATLGVVFLGEQLNAQGWCGITLIVGGLVVLIMKSRKR
jgi:DME family drug/metabolite transporter